MDRRRPGAGRGRGVDHRVRRAAHRDRPHVRRPTTSSGVTTRSRTRRRSLSLLDGSRLPAGVDRHRDRDPHRRDRDDRPGGPTTAGSRSSRTPRCSSRSARPSSSSTTGSFEPSGAGAYRALHEQGAVTTVGDAHAVTDDVATRWTGKHGPGHQVLEISSQGERATFVGHLALEPGPLPDPGRASSTRTSRRRTASCARWPTAASSSARSGPPPAPSAGPATPSPPPTRSPEASGPPAVGCRPTQGQVGGSVRDFGVVRTGSLAAPRGWKRVVAVRRDRRRTAGAHGARRRWRATRQSQGRLRRRARRPGSAGLRRLPARRADRSGGATDVGVALRSARRAT